MLKNLLNRNIGDVELFVEFSELSFEIAMYPITFEERKQFISDLNTALLMFSENTDIDAYVLNLIKDTQKRIKETYAVICKEEYEFLEKKNQTIVEQNNKLLNELADIFQIMCDVSTQSRFDEKMKIIAEIDGKLEKTMFTETQQVSYEKLTKHYTKMISKKMEELNRLELLEYNKSAVRNINKVLQKFKNREDNYKKSSSLLKPLLTSSFLIFDTSKLFNETMVFYNHVYSLIFQTVDDDLKYQMTEWALSAKEG